MTRMMRQERLQRGWSLEYVAEKVGLTAEAIRLIETGHRNPSYSILSELEDLFHINHRDLFGSASTDHQCRAGSSERPTK